MTFDQLDLNDDLLDALYDMHFDECTPIQQQSIPPALLGRDILAVAQTGTGKTAAYLLPVISMISDSDLPSDAINCIVMAPTRELAQQIDRQMEGFSYFINVNSLAIYGGTDGKEFARQERGLKLGADVVIATPGRLLAHMQMGYVDLSRVSYFILDEADRMLDMGFYDDIIKIARQLPDHHQTLLFSATMPPKIKQLAKQLLNDPVEIKIAPSRPAEKIDQSAYICYETEKYPILRHILHTVSNRRVIIFASSKLGVKDLANRLRRDRYAIGEMHSDLDQNRRDEVMQGFRSGSVEILVATDIVARGIDIDDISLVVNYDVPHEADDYVHRVGRTARAGSGGVAVTLVADKDRPKFARIEKFLGKPIRRGQLPPEMSADRPDRKHNSKQKNRPVSNSDSNSDSKKTRHNRHNRNFRQRKNNPRPPKNPDNAPNPEQN